MIPVKDCCFLIKLVILTPQSESKGGDLIPNLVKGAVNNSAMTADGVQQESQVPLHELGVRVGGSQYDGPLKHKLVDDHYNDQCFPGSSVRLQKK